MHVRLFVVGSVFTMPYYLSSDQCLLLASVQCEQTATKRVRVVWYVS